MNISPLPYNGEATELTWPQVTEIEITRYTFCRYWCLYQIPKVWYWYLKNCSHSQILNIFWGRFTWPDLVTWPEKTFGWNFLEGCEINVWEGIQETARRNSRKTSWCGQNNHPPPPPGRRLMYWCGRLWLWLHGCGAGWLWKSPAVKTSNADAWLDIGREVEINDVNC